MMEPRESDLGSRSNEEIFEFARSDVLDKVKEEISHAIEHLPHDPGALYSVMDSLKSLREYFPADYERFRQKIKDTKTIRINEVDRLTRPPGELESSQIDVIIDIAKESAEFFHNENSDGFADVKNNDVVETWPIRSQGFAMWLRNAFYLKAKSGISDFVLKAAIETLISFSINEGEQHEVHLRVARQHDGYLLDLGDGKRRAVEISSDGWKVIERPSVKFVRTPNSRTLPHPIAGTGNLNLLWAHLNIRPEDRLLVLAFILECWRPETPFALLVLLGEQGSAKSSGQRTIRDLIDPNKVMLRAAPREVSDIAIAAFKNWLVSYENLSSLTPQEQDVLCVILTGGGVAGREYYTNFEEAAIAIKRPVILNGIATVVTRPDLLDRAIILDLPNIPDSNRRENSECDATWARDRSLVFAGLLDLFAASLAELPNVRLQQLPRMADFTRLGEAMTRVLGFPPGFFLSLYNKMRSEAVDIVLDGDPVAIALEEHLECNRIVSLSKTTKALFEVLSEHKMASRRDFPRSARGLGSALRRLAPVFRQRGWDIRQEKKEKGIVVTIECRENSRGYETSAERSDIQPEQLNVLNVSAPPANNEEYGCHEVDLC